MTKFEKELLNSKRSEIIITNDVLEADLITHNGTFHADEVFSTVILSRILKKDKIKIHRTSKVPENTEAFVYDVGLGKYDHHQQGGNGARENGIKYSSCGLVWRDFGKDYLNNINVKQIDILWEDIDKALIQNIDAVDNGQLEKISQFDFEIMTIPSLISLYNSNWDDEEANQDENFLQAVEFASKIFDKILVRAYSKIEAREKVIFAINNSKNQILILDKFMPWQEFLLDSENPVAKDILFVIFPSIRGGYNVYAVPKEKGSFESRKLLPEEWAGLTGEEFQKIANVSTARFCHTGRFICVAETKEDALKLAEIAVNK